MCVAVTLLSPNNRYSAPEYQYAHKEAHEYIWYWRGKSECQISSYDDEDVSEGIVPGTEPDSTEIETIVLKFLEEPSREEIHDESEKSYSRHDFAFWYPTIQIFPASPDEHPRAEKYHEVAFYFSDIFVCFFTFFEDK